MVMLTDAGNFPNMPAAGLIGGYQFSQHFGVEVENFASYDALSVAGTGIYDYKQNIFTAAFMATYPLSKSFGLFGKLGLDSISTSRTLNAPSGPTTNSAITSNLVYGIGIQYYITSHWGIRGQYEYLGKSKLDSSAAGADTTRAAWGVFYNF